MNAEYYQEYFSRYADLSEEDAIRVQCGAVEMEVIESISTDINDKVAHQASIILGLNIYKNNKDAYIQEICYNTCTADCEIQKVIDKCKAIVDCNDSCDLEEDLSILCRLLTLDTKLHNTDSLGYVCEDLQRSYLIHEKPEYNQLSSDIDYILYDLLDILDLSTDKSKEYVYKHREKFMRPIMDLALNSGDVMLMEQMKQIYKNWMEWR